MWHLAWSMGWLARAAEDARLGRRPPINRLPPRYADSLRALAMRWLARGATPRHAAQAYDAGHHALLAKLALVREEEWQRAVERFGERRTVAWHFRQPVAHFSEHAADVRAALLRRA